MKATCSIPSLKAALRMVSGAVERVKFGPTDMLLQATGGELALLSTDYVVSIETAIDAIVQQEGSVVIPVDLILNWMDNMGDGKVALEEKGANLYMVTSASRARLAGRTAGAFPDLPTPGDGGVDVDGSDLLRAIGRVAYAAARDDSKPTMKGIQVNTDETGRLVLGALNGYQMALASLDVTGDELHSLVLASCLGRLSKVLLNGAAQVRTNGNMVSFHQGRTIVQMRQLDAVPMDLTQLLERNGLLADPSTVSVVESKVLLGALATAEVLADEHRIVKGTRPVDMVLGDGGITISSAGQSGDGQVTIPAGLIGPERRLRVSGNMLAEGVRASGATDVELGMLNGDRALTIRVPGATGWQGLQMLMEGRDG